MYEQKGKTTKITATSRCSVKVNDNFYTIECSEERSLPETNDVNVEAEWTFLFNDLNKIVDNQCAEIVSAFKK